jgi:hypothetical protein
VACAGGAILRAPGLNIGTAGLRTGGATAGGGGASGAGCADAAAEINSANDAVRS